MTKLKDIDYAEKINDECDWDAYESSSKDPNKKCAISSRWYNQKKYFATFKEAYEYLTK